MRVLIADDNADNLYLLETLLKCSGYEVLMAKNGIEALDLLKQEEVGLIISDILMPKMDGFQLCREIRGDNLLRDIPFVFYTATYTSEEDEDFALGLGADKFILKPAEPEAFLGIITGVLQNARKGLIQPALPKLDEDGYLHDYSLRLKGKLEDKMAQIVDSERRYRNLFNSLRDAVIVMDLHGVIQDANQPALRNTFGYEVEELKGARFWELLDVEDQPDPAVDAVLKKVANGEGKVVEAAFRKKGAGSFDGELSVSELIGDDGAPVGKIGVIRDISAQKLLEAQLRQAQKLEAVGRLAGGVAHDFNNYLTVIIGYVEILKRRKPQWDVVEEKLNQVHKAALHSRDVIRQLLAFSRKEIIAPVPVKINALIEEQCKNLGRLIGEDIRMQLDLDPELWFTKLDPTQFHQIVMNLTVNARDAMPKGGNLSFSTSNVTIDEAFLVEHPEATPGEYVKLEVTDTGCGMDQDTLRQIFEPFFTTKEVGKGTGLGLATLYGIVSQNKGFVSVTSMPGGGASFVIFFPRFSETSVVKKATAPLPAPKSGSGVILLVEDDELVRDVTTGMLESLGYCVIAKSNPEDAVSFCSSDNSEIDVVIADVVMPGMSGKEMMKRIEACRCDLPVIYISGYSPEITSAQGILDEGAHFVRKPFDVETLHKEIVSVIEKV